jgi:hypothetical protein
MHAKTVRREETQAAVFQAETEIPSPAARFASPSTCFPHRTPTLIGD